MPSQKQLLGYGAGAALLYGIYALSTKNAQAAAAAKAAATKPLADGTPPNVFPPTPGYNPAANPHDVTTIGTWGGVSELW